MLEAERTIFGNLLSIAASQLAVFHSVRKIAVLKRIWPATKKFQNHSSLVFRTTLIPLQDMELRKMWLKVFFSYQNYITLEAPRVHAY